MGEVKYKPKIDESDRYQVLSHVLAAQCNLGVWISPSADGAQGGMEYVGSVSNGVKFYHYRIDISGELEAASVKMVNAVSALL